MVEDNASHAGHLSTLALYGLSVAATVGVATVTKRPLPGRMRMRDLVVAAAAAQKLSRTVTKSSVTRAVARAVRRACGRRRSRRGRRRARREGAAVEHRGLLTCPFCMDVWAISGLTAGRVFAPAATGVVTDALAALAGADFLQLAYARAQQAAE
ncbi:DUF1360 domain-containing protein [Rhodococcus hoagii]|nr:DUF1360 domain-containing protein [Prescottella equi]